MRTTRAALQSLGFSDELLRHGIKREVFISTLADNSEKILRTGKGSPELASLLRVEEVAGRAIERWVVPRSKRRTEYLSWEREQIWSLLGTVAQKIANVEAATP